MLKRIAEADEEGFTDEECPAWNHPELDQYVVCLRCEHYQDDCPHECGPEFGFDDVAACLEERAATIARQDRLLTALRAEHVAWEEGSLHEAVAAHDHASREMEADDDSR